MKNKLSDLNDHLFAQIERLGDTDLEGDQLNTEINRSKAMAQIATQIVNSAKITVDAMKLLNRDGSAETGIIKNLIGGKSN
jgi:hypothetical protein